MKAAVVSCTFMIVIAVVYLVAKFINYTERKHERELKDYSQAPGPCSISKLK